MTEPTDGARETPSDTPMSQRVEAAADGATPAVGFPEGPRIRPVTQATVSEALKAGWEDFKAAPAFGLFFGGVFVFGGFLLFGCVTLWDTPWAILPLAVAFPLLGPFVAVGLYEVSRRLSSGEPLAWGEILSVVVRQKDRQLAWMGFIVLFIFWMWAYNVRLLLAIFLGFSSFSTLDGFMNVVLGTENGIAFLGVGVITGTALALILFCVTVISMPLLVDRDVDFITAIATSIAAVRRNPVPMLAWGAVVTVAMVVALLPFFLGLLVVLPVLGHATWRLYERAIVRETAA